MNEYWQYLILIISVLLLSTSCATEIDDRARTFCQDDESIILSCDIGSKKLSLCLKSKKDLSYRYGEYPEIELELLSDLEYASIPTSGGAEEQLSFTNGDYDYIVYDYLHNGDWIDDERGVREKLEGTGIYVFKDGIKVADKKCTSFSGDNYFNTASLTGKLNSDVDNTIEGTIDADPKVLFSCSVGTSISQLVIGGSKEKRIKFTSNLTKLNTVDWHPKHSATIAFTSYSRGSASYIKFYSGDCNHYLSDSIVGDTINSHSVERFITQTCGSEVVTVDCEGANDGVSSLAYEVLNNVEFVEENNSGKNSGEDAASTEVISNLECVFDRDYFTESRYADNKKIVSYHWDSDTLSVSGITQGGDTFIINHTACEHAGTQAVLLVAAGTYINDDLVRQKIVQLAHLALDEHLVDQLVEKLVSTTISGDQGTVLIPQTFVENSFSYRQEGGILIVEISFSLDI